MRPYRHAARPLMARSSPPRAISHCWPSLRSVASRLRTRPHRICSSSACARVPRKRVDQHVRVSGLGGVSIKFGGGFYQYSILMYPAVFRCILLKYCILAYSDVFQNVFSYLLVCDRDTLCFMYSNVFRMYSECILRICGAPRRPRG